LIFKLSSDNIAEQRYSKYLSKEQKMKRFLKKTVALAVLGLICIFAAVGQNAVELDAAIQQAGREINLKFAMAPRVALLNFNSSASDLSSYVLRELAQNLGRSGSATIISRADTDRALASANLRSSGDVTDAAARTVGRTLNARFVITGSFEKAGDNYRFRAKMLDVSSGAVQTAPNILVRENAHLRQLLGIVPQVDPPVQAEPVPLPAPVTEPAPPRPDRRPPPAPAPAVPTPPPAAPAIKAYQIGETGPAGGLIFFDKGNNSDGWRYLEAAPSDLPAKLKPVTENINRSESSERIVGRGRTNTQAIMREAADKGGGFGWAAQGCTTFSLNGFSDWFLPSRDELNWVYGNLHMKRLGSFKGETYLTSTASGTSSGVHFWNQNFADGRQSDYSHTYEYWVRPIRQVAGPN